MNCAKRTSVQYFKPGLIRRCCTQLVWGRAPSPVQAERSSAAAGGSSNSGFALGLIGLAFLLLLSPRDLHAQGCAMCYQSAAASGARFIHALKSGIVVIVIPPLLMTGIFARFVYHRRNLFHEDIVEHHEV